MDDFKDLDMPILKEHEQHPSSDWKVYATVFGVVLAIVLSLGTLIRSAVTDDDLDRYRQTYHEPMLKRIESLEMSRDGFIKDLATLNGSINVLKIQMSSFETGQTRVEGMLRDTTSELKTMVREVSNKLERYQGRAPSPQDWWDEEWHLGFRPWAKVDQ